MERSDPRELKKAMESSFWRRPGVLGSAIILIAAGVLTILTVLRYRDRDRSATPIAHATGHHETYQVTWDHLPKIDDFELTERAGVPWSTADVDGKVWIASFFFSRCPSICRRQNEAIERLQTRLQDRDVTFVSITCDPAYDTPQILSQYAARFSADPDRWKFLTGALDRIVDVGQRNFRISVGPETHATSLMVIDRWGRFRDRIDWEQSQELDRLEQVVDECLAETEPPVGKQLETRVPFADGAAASDSDGETHPDPHARRTVISPQAVADLVGDEWRDLPWIDRFTMIDRRGATFDSESMKGKVWVASFFFTRCPSICKRLNDRVRSLHAGLADRDVTFVSITSDSTYDMPVRLAAYARDLGVADDDDRWRFLVGEPLQTRRVAAEFFTAFADGEAHDEHLILLDKWNRVRGKYRYDDDAAIAQMRSEIEKLLSESEPPDLTPVVPIDPADLESELEGEGDGEADAEAGESDAADLEVTEPSETLPADPLPGNDDGSER